MPLALRLALAFVLVAVGATALWGVRVRTTSRSLMEADFSARIEAATHEVEESLALEATQVRDLTVPLCSRGTFLEKALVDLERQQDRLAECWRRTLRALRDEDAAPPVGREPVVARTLPDAIRIVFDTFQRGDDDLAVALGQMRARTDDPPWPR